MHPAPPVMMRYTLRSSAIDSSCLACALSIPDENPDETIKIAAEVTGADEESTKVSLESRERKISIDDDLLKNPVEETLEFAKEQGLVDDSLSYDDIVDTSYFENSGIED